MNVSNNGFDSDMPSDLFYIINYSSKLVTTAIGLIFSFVIIFTISFNRQCYNVANLLDCNASVASVFHLAIAFVAAVYGVGDHWAWATPYCIARAYLSVALIGTIFYSYSFQAISRMFFAVFYKYRYLLSWRTHFIMIFLNWFIGFFTAAIPLLFIRGGYGLEIESRACVMSSKRFLPAIVSVIISYLIPVTIIIFIYVMIVYHVYQSSRRVTAFNQNAFTNTPGRSAKRELKMVRRLMIQTTCLISTGSLFLVNVFWQKVTTRPLPKPMYLLGFTLMTNAFALMVVVQFFLNKNVKEIVYQRFCQKSQNDNQRTVEMTVNNTQQTKPAHNKTMNIYRT